MSKYGPEISPYLDTFRTVNTMEIVRTIFRSLFEDTTITISFLKNHICSTYVLKLMHCLLFSTIKDCGSSKSDQIIVYFKELVLVNGTFFSSINVMNLVTEN